MAKKDFEPIQHYKKDKKTGEYVLDNKGCRIKIDLYKGTKFDEMVEFLKENGTKEEKEQFKKACYTKKVYEEVIGKRGGKKKVATNETIPTDTINVYYAKEWFFTQFAPNFLPQAQEKTTKKSMEDLLGEL